MAGKPRKKRAYHHGDLERTLIEASLEVIADSGPEDFTLRDIARRVGVAPSAPYRHFRDKDALLAAVASECAERLGEAMDKASEDAGPDVLEQFRASGIAYVRFAVENPAHFRVMNMPRIAASQPMEAGVGDWMETRLAELKAAQKRGELAAFPADMILLATRAMTYGLSRLIVDAQDGLNGISPERAVQLAAGVTDILGAGLLPREARKTKK